MDRSLGLILTIITSFSSTLNAADCPASDPGLVLSITPKQVPIGSPFQVTIDAPPGNLVVLLESASEGPLQTPWGTLCVGTPFLPFVFVMPNQQVSFPHLIQCVPAYVGLFGNFQFLSAAPAGSVGISNSQSFEVIDGACTATVEAGDYASFTQGGWGTSCSGNNPGCLRDQNFPAAFPNGLLLGDADGPDGDNAHSLLLTSSAAVQAFLPQGGKASPFDSDYTDVFSTSAGVFAGQLVAAKLNVGFDDVGAFDAMKDDPAGKLQNLVYVANAHPALLGKTVSEVIALCDQMISTEVSAPILVDGQSVSISELNAALDLLNNEFVDGNQALGSLGSQHVPAP